jgi:uncharacterized protein (TIGR02001 family)
MMKKFQVLAVSAVAAGLAMASPAVAEEEERAFAWSFTAGATSDYIFRGISFTGEDPAAQGSIDISWGKLYAGAWASNINGTGFEPWELDLYAGYKPVVGQFTFDFGGVVYLYPDADEGPDTEYYELKAGVSTEIVKGLTGGVTLWFTPDQSNYSETYSVEGTLAYTFAPIGIFTPTVSGLVGYTEDTDDTGIFALGASVDSYTYWNAGLALAVEKFVFDFRYWDTDVSSDPASEDLTDSRFVFSAKVTLP